MGYEAPQDYKEVPQRIADLKAVHPDARLRPANPEKPFDIVNVDGKTYIVYVAACYRDADDVLPGIGVAWEPFPGKTPYTKDSELMNAETSAWGRAIVATLRSESKSIASAEDVRNRQADQQHTEPAKSTPRRETHGTVRQPPARATESTEPDAASQKQLGMIAALFKDKGFLDDRAVRHLYVTEIVGREIKSAKDLTRREASKVIEALMAESVQEGFEPLREGEEAL